MRVHRILKACLLAGILSTGMAGAADEIHWTIMGASSVTFDWRGADGSTLERTIEWGTSPGVYTHSRIGGTPSPLPTSSAGPFYEAPLTGLAPDTLYYYRIAGGPMHTFRTPPLPGDSGFWIAVEADVGSTDSYPAVGPVQEQIATDNPLIPGDDRPRFVIVNGDLTYGDDKGAEDVDQHFNDVMAWSRDAAYMPTWGNHEYGGPVGDMNDYEGRFDLPNDQTSPNAPSAGGPGEDWYWFDYGNVRFVTMPEPWSGAISDWEDSVIPVVEEADADPDITFVVTVGHRQTWSSGCSHEKDGTGSINDAVRAVRAVTSKHRLHLQAHDHSPEVTVPSLTDGIVHLRATGGGSSISSCGVGGYLSSTPPPWSAFRISHLAIFRIHFSSDRITGYIECGPDGTGSDDCVQGELLHSWTIDAQGGVVDPGGRPEEIFYVSTQGNDGNPGSIDAPWRTIGHAADQLLPGDRLLIRGGIYHETPTISASGTAEAPIRISSYPGETAILDSGPAEFRVAGNSDWEPVGNSRGEYRSIRAFPSSRIYAYLEGVPGYMNERVVLVPYKNAAEFRAQNEAYVDGSTPFFVGPGTFWDPADSRIHIRLVKTSDMRAAEARHGSIFAGDIADPRDHPIVLSLSRSTLTVRGSHLVFENLVINQAQESITLGTGAHHVRFDGITVWLGDSAIEADSPGVHDITVTNSRIYGDSPYWIFWSDMKDAPAPADRLRNTSIDLRSGTRDWEIAYNHIRGSGQDLIGTNDDETGILIHHNRMENCGDDALELEGTLDVGAISVYENYILNCLTAVAPGQDSPSFTGPLFVYRNTFAMLRNPPINRAEGINGWNGGGRFGYEYMLKQHSGNTHYYHNTMVMLGTAGRGMNLVPRIPGGTVVANNLLVMVNGRVQGSDYRTGAGQIINGNLYWKMNPLDTSHLLSSFDTVPAFSAATGFEREGLGDMPRTGTDPRLAGLALQVVDSLTVPWELRPGSEVFPLTAFFLGATSPGIGAGIAIPPHPVLGVLPDTRSSRDIGAFPYGTTPQEVSFFPFTQGDDPRPDDTTAPSVVIIAPARDSTVSGPTILMASATDDVGVAGVRFSLDGSDLGPEDVDPPFATSWDASSSPAGPHILTATARDGAGNSASHDLPVTIAASVVDDVPPGVVIIYPASNATVTGPTIIMASASDDVGVAGVRFSLDGQSLAPEDTVAPWAITWDPGPTPAGTHTLRAVARDDAGNTASFDLPVVVEHPVADTAPPTVSVTEPVAGSMVWGPTALSAHATDDVGVAGVQFTLDGSPIGAEDTTAPYSIVWDMSQVKRGTHHLAAIARDEAGKTTVSSAISISVRKADNIPPRKPRDPKILD